MKYLRRFNTLVEFNKYNSSDEYIRPNILVCDEIRKTIFYNPINKINKITPIVIVPVPNVLTYNKSAQKLATNGSTDFGTIKYSLDNLTWSTTMPTGTNGGTYRLYYKVEGNNKVNDVKANSILCSIAEKRVTEPTIILSQNLYTYNGSSCTPIPTVKDGDDIIDPIEYNVLYLNNVNAGTASVIISDIVDGNYYIEGVQTFTINKGNLNAQVSMSGWSYGSTASNPSIIGNNGNGTVIYSYKVSGTDDSTYTSTKPSEIGTYIIRAQIEETTNYNSAILTSTFSISKGNLNAQVSMSGWTYGGTHNNPTITGNSGNGTVIYSYKVSGAADSTYTTTIPSNAGTYVIRAQIAETSNYNAATVTTIFTISKVNPIVTAPTPKTLTYNGSAQELINSGFTNYGTLKYAVVDYISSPYDAEVEYLLSDGRQYIDLPITPTSTIGIYIKVKPQMYNYMGSDDQYMVGIRDNSGDTRWCLGKSGQNKVAIYWGYGGYSHIAQYKYGEIYTCSLNYLNSKVAKVNNDSALLSSSLSFTPQNRIRIFGSSGVNSSYSKAAIYLYECKISQGTEIIMDLIPVRKNGIGYLYDKLNDTLYGNIGESGYSFTIGPDLKNYIPSAPPNNEYTTSIPSKTDAGNYIVYYKVEGDNNINSTSTNYIQCTID